MASGESIPFSAEMLSVELLGESARMFDSEFVRHAAKAVFHYFKHDLAKQTVTIGEFTTALEKVLVGFTRSAKKQSQLPSAKSPRVLRADLRRIASESGKGCELFFFPRLRDELRAQLHRSPEVVHFRGLRGCVKQLAGAQRWSPRCQTLGDQIVEFLRHCLTVEGKERECGLVVN
jgi:hypothetical protein